MSTRVFLSYSRSDTAWAERVRLRLTDVGLASFLDRYGLPAGQAWQPQLEAQIAASGCVLVLCGPSGIGNWQQREISLALDRQAGSANFPVIPVLLPGLEEPPVGSFLSLNTWIDLRANPDDPHAWQALIAGAAGSAVDHAEQRLLGTVCPYRGLQAFREEDAGLFFGRAREVDALVAKVSARSSSNVVGVIGSSGSGKSSIILAGLIPALRRSRGGSQSIWKVLRCTPGPEPLQSLVRLFERPREDASAVAMLARLNDAAALLREGRVTLNELVRQHLAESDEQGTDRLLLVVDQWEELYTQAAAEEYGGRTDANRFIDIVLDAARQAPMTLVFTVRADFYDRLIAHPRLKQVLDSGLVSVGPLDRDDVVAAIEAPARALGYDVQPQLTRLLLSDSGFGQSGDDAGAYDAGRLPLLEFALERIWHRAHAAGRATLQAQDYIDVGRLEGALEATANAQYERLSPAARQAAKRLFLSLVTPGAGRADARLRTPVPADPAIGEVLAAFASSEARLISTDADFRQPGIRFTQVTHEALLRHWALLREWVHEQREVLGWRDQVREAFLRWQQHGEASDYLLPRGLQLELGRNLLARRNDLLIDDLLPYISRSIDQDDRLRLAERSRLRRWVGVLAAATVVATLCAGGALFFYGAARDEAAAITKQAHLVEEQSWRALGALARGYLFVGDPGTALLLALRAIPQEGTVDANDGPIIDAAAGTIWNALANIRERTTLPSLHGSVYDLAADDDGKLLVSGGSDGTVRIWWTENGSWSSERLAQHEGHINAVALSSDSRWVAAAGTDGVVRLWPGRREGAPIVLDGHSRRVRQLTFSPDNRKLASTGEDGTVRLWDIQTRRETGRFVGHGDYGVWSVAFSPDGRYVASAADDETIQVWSADQPDHTVTLLRGHKGSVMSVTFSPDGKVLASAGWDGTVRIWPLDGEQKPQVLYGHDGRVQMVRFSADGSRLISAGEDGTIRIWPRNTEVAPVIMRGHEGGIWSVRLTRDGRTLFSGGMDGTIRIWQADRAPQPASYQQHSSPITALAYNGDGKQMASGSEGGEVILHVSDDPTLSRVLLNGQQTGAVRALAFSRRVGRLASGHQDGDVRIWSIGDDHDDQPADDRLAVLSHGAPLTAVAFGTEDNTLYSAGSDGTIRRWDGNRGSLVYKGSSPIRALSTSIDGGRLAAGDEDGNVLLWNLRHPGEPRILRGFHAPIRAVAFNPDGRRLVVAGSRGQVKIVDCEEAGPMEDLHGQLGEVTAAAVGPLNARIVTAGADGAIRIWHPAAAIEAWVQRAHEEAVTAIAFSPDGSHLVSGGGDRMMRVWYLGRSFEELVARACAILPRDLTAAQRLRLGLKQGAA